MTYRTINFKSKDGLRITADEYTIPKPKAYIVLCHRSHFNRGEYRETAVKLNALGYSCLAIDQRSGMEVLGTTNETYLLAKQQGLETGYLAAKPDIQTAIDYAYKQSGEQPIILLGSSYSASLAILIASEDTRKIKALVAFSPGEYLKGVSVADATRKLDIKTLVLSAKKEIKDTEKLLEGSNSTLISQFKPKSDGAHGSRVLWEKTASNDEYWAALRSFLSSL